MNCNPMQLVMSQIVRFKSNLYGYDDKNSLVGSGSLDVSLKDPTSDSYILVDNTTAPILLTMNPVDPLSSLDLVLPKLTKYEYMKIHSLDIQKVNVSVVVQFRPADINNTDFVLYFRCKAFPGALEEDHDEKIPVFRDYWKNVTNPNGTMENAF